MLSAPKSKIARLGHKSTPAFEQEIMLRSSDKKLTQPPSKHKSARIDPQLYQAVTPPECKLNKAALRASILQRNVYQHDRVSRGQLAQYLQFVDWLMTESENDGAMLGSTGKQKHQQNALQFLGKMGYNVVRAKFYILFPCMQYASKFTGESLDLSDQQMQSEIDSHIDSLKNNRAKTTQRWRAGLQTLLREKASLQRVNNYLDQAKQLKIQIPEQIKQEIEAVNKSSRQIKRMLNNGGKFSFQELMAKRDSLQMFRIQSSQFLLFRGVLDRVCSWREKRKQLEQSIIQIDGKSGLPVIAKKINAQVAMDLKSQLESLPLQDNSEQFNSILNAVSQINRELADLRINQFIQEREKPGSKQTLRIIQLLEKAPLESQETERIKNTLKAALQARQRVLMALEDHRHPPSYQHLIQILQPQPVSFQIQIELKHRHAYHQKLTEIKSRLNLPDVDVSLLAEELALMSKRYHSVELEQLGQEVGQVCRWQQLVKGVGGDWPRFYGQILEGAGSIIMVQELIYVLLEGQKHKNANKTLLQNLSRKKYFFESTIIPVHFESLPQLFNFTKRIFQNGISSQQTTKIFNQAVRSLQILSVFISTLRQYKRSYDPTLPLLEHQFLLDRARHSITIESLLQSLQQSHSFSYIKSTSQYQVCMKLARQASDWELRTKQFLGVPLNERSQKTLDQMLAQYLPKNQELVKELIKARKALLWDKQIKGKFQCKYEELSAQSIALLQRCECIVKRINSQQNPSQKIKESALQFMLEEDQNIRNLMKHWLNQPASQKSVRKQQLNRQLKELSQNENSPEIDSLKEYLQTQIRRLGEWKQNNDEAKKDRTGYYFRLPIALINYYKGISISPSLEEINRMRAMFKQIIDISEQLAQTPLNFQELSILNDRIKQHNVFFPQFHYHKRMYRYLQQWRCIADKIIKTMPVIRCQERLATDALKPQLIIQEREKRKIRPSRVYSNQGMIVDGYLHKQKKKKDQAQGDAGRATDSAQVVETSPPYCICLRGDLNADIQWIDCDRCKRWFHSECLFLKLNPCIINPSYICGICSVRYNQPSNDQICQLSPWQLNQRISLDVWRQVWQESMCLPVLLKQAEIVQSIERERIQLISQAQKIVTEVVGSKSRGEFEYIEKQAALLIGKCLWMPFKLDILDKLIFFIKNLDFGKNLNRAMSSRSKKQIKNLIEQGCQNMTEQNGQNIQRAKKKLQEIERQFKTEVIKDGYQKIQIKGQVFEGNWVDGSLKLGRTLKPDGELIYDGEFKQLKFHGRGVQYNVKRATLPQNFNFYNLDFSCLGNSWMKYEGEFEKGRRHGIGCIFLDDDLVFRGEFKHGEANGEGCFQRGGVALYRGTWKKNKNVD